MKSFIVMTFALLGWAWYAMSGGADFEPGANSVQLPNLLASGFVSKAEAHPASMPEVTRASTVSLADVSAPESPDGAPLKAAGEALDVTLAAAPNQPIAASFDPEGTTVATAHPTKASADAMSGDLRRVTGTRVNMRYGPGTSYSVVGQLAEGDEVEILSDPGDGWVKLQARKGGSAGWMYDAYLSASN
ncbi:SH3 domain-containing protein [Salipiger mangrovisoli]|uniref:SH3 domain-containing protein n=1 Tax=Salipiger mangrovisoli TaxID=2865933 RepID=A0ABR9XBD4_9RHOB|nr:SH3 domain-containing protein [Salipiger mangrovisoli]MBE9640930.1 SH3 domain-containing protein [Salipiger mangrovisoli]